MKAKHDLSKLKSRRNSDTSKVKRAVSTHLSDRCLEYFKGMADEAGVLHQSLIHMYLRDGLGQNTKSVDQLAEDGLTLWLLPGGQGCETVAL